MKSGKVFSPRIFPSAFHRSLSRVRPSPHHLSLQPAPTLQGKLAKANLANLATLQGKLAKPTATSLLAISAIWPRRALARMARLGLKVISGLKYQKLFRILNPRSSNPRIQDSGSWWQIIFFTQGRPWEEEGRGRLQWHHRPSRFPRREASGSVIFPQVHLPRTSSQFQVQVAMKLGQDLRPKGKAGDVKKWVWKTSPGIQLQIDVSSHLADPWDEWDRFQREKNNPWLCFSMAPPGKWMQ